MEERTVDYPNDFVVELFVYVENNSERTLFVEVV